MKTIFNKEQIGYITENYKTMSYAEIANNLGFTERQIRGKINNMGLTKNRKINDRYFKNIDTPDKAYLLGFIYADGWICYNKDNRCYEFGIELQSEDKYILEFINNELGGLNIIKHKNPTKRVIGNEIANVGDMDTLRIYSKNLVLDLENNGISKNKTLHGNIYPKVNDNLFFDYLRGYIDGDGCFYKNKTHINMHITCSSDIPLKYVKKQLVKYNINTYIYQEKERKYRLVCCNDESMTILVNKLYYSDKLICLKRKYEKIKSLIYGSAA